VIVNHALLQELRDQLDGNLYHDKTMRSLYATDASIYRELPMAVAIPKNISDLKKIIAFANKNSIGIIPRTAGTSLAGQCVGNGIVVDVSVNFTKIIEVNPEQSYVRVQPGVVRDELNQFLAPHGLYFGPNTSTANRAMIGGMVGNNSCGSYSIVYGTTRDHVEEVHAILYDGSEVVFGALDDMQFNEKCLLNNAEGKIYRQIRDGLMDADRRALIEKEYPAAVIHRRNTGYAVDVLMRGQPFNPEGKPFNMCQLICGSEGSLCFITEIKLHLDPLPPKEQVLICAHFNSIHDAMLAVLEILPHHPRAVELMDHHILDCTKDHIEFSKYRFFVEGEPQAILVLELGDSNVTVLEQRADALMLDLKEKTKATAWPKVYGVTDIRKVWKLREAGLGLLSNFPGDAKPVAVIEDTAVELPKLPAYIDEFSDMMKGFGQDAVYYAHAGAGELHLRPVLNLKTTEGTKMLRSIAHASAELVKKYNGSLSGEHGDGRLRAEFIPLMIGEKNYEFLREIKSTWDPQHIFNPGKIVDAPPMDVQLRYTAPQAVPSFDTILNFDESGGILRAAEKCNGSGDCRKSAAIGGTMCPSYMASKKEKDTTRARANILREFLTNSETKTAFTHEEIYEVMDLCLSCKGCKSECPSNVDMALLKAEFLYQYYKKKGLPLRNFAMGNIAQANRLGAHFPAIFNAVLKNPFTSGIIKKTIGIAEERNLPLLYKETLKRWFRKNKQSLNKIEKPIGRVYFYADEFTNYNDVEIGIKSILLLSKLGYQVSIPKHTISGRAYISKGMLEEAKKLANRNVQLLKDKISEQTPLIGVEPSCILGFRDEFPKLVNEDLIPAAKAMSKNCLMIDEFIAGEIDKGNIAATSFSEEPMQILLHGHCHQKTLSDVNHSVKLMSLPKNYTVNTIASGCCGMAGSFGYEKEHYEMSMQVGELVLFPAVRKAVAKTISAPGTSCRHQILDGTGVKAKHPVEILYEALNS